jgi:glycine cleavage system aminomethyltransferase T
LNQSIGVALVDPELATVDAPLEIFADRKLVKGQLPEKQTMNATIVPMPFYDPKGDRVRR